MKKKELQTLSFKMIGIVGQAKHHAQKAFNDYKSNANKKKLIESLKNAKIKLREAGVIHMNINKIEAQEKNVPFSTIFVHAQDQFMTVQMMIEMLIMINE